MRDTHISSQTLNAEVGLTVPKCRRVHGEEEPATPAVDRLLHEDLRLLPITVDINLREAQLQQHALSTEAE